MIGANIVKMYSNPVIPIGILVLSPTVVLVFRAESQRPPKKRNRDTCRSPGTASATTGMYPSFRSFLQILSKSGTLQRITIPLEDVHVIANPLLNETRKEHSRETEDEGHEPEYIYADVR